MWGSLYKDLCAPHHLIIIILVLIVAVLLGATGKGLSGVISAIIKRFSGKDVNINIGGGAVAGEKEIPKECEGCGLVIDPTKCVMHQSEHERSKRNEAQITALWEEYGKLRNESLAATGKLKDEMVAGFKEVTISINESNRVILGALAGTRNGFSKPGRGGTRE